MQLSWLSHHIHEICPCLLVSGILKSFFELWCWRRILRVPWTSRRSNQWFLKEINPEYSLEGLMLKLKLQYFGHLIWTDSFDKTLMLERLKAGGEGENRGQMVGWNHQLDGCESEQTPGHGERQGVRHAAVHEAAKSRTWQSDWTTITYSQAMQQGEGEKKPFLPREFMAKQRDKKIEASSAAYTQANKQARGLKHCASLWQRCPEDIPLALTHVRGNDAHGVCCSGRAGQNCDQFFKTVTMQITAESSWRWVWPVFKLSALVKVVARVLSHYYHQRTLFLKYHMIKTLDFKRNSGSSRLNGSLLITSFLCPQSHFGCPVA